MFFQALALSLGGLFVGPLLFTLGRGRALASAALDGLTLGLVPLLVLLHIVPHLHAEIGLAAVGLVALGYAGVLLLERQSHAAGERVGRAVAVPALTVHALLDGAALSLASSEAVGTGSATMLLSSAIVLHRVPEGLFVTRALGPAMGPRGLWAALALLGGATVAGALGGQELLRHAPDSVLHGAIALGLGAMLRLVTHRHGPGPTSRGARGAAAVAFLLSVALVVLIPSPEGVLTRARTAELPIIASLGPLFVETAPSMLAGLAGAGLLHVFAPRHVSSWLGGKGAPSQAVRGIVFGLPLPVCSCGILPLLRRLLAAGAPVAAVIAFAIATPELDVGGASLSLRLFGARFTALRIGMSLFAALSVAIVVSAVSPPRAPALEPSPPGGPPFPSNAPRGPLVGRARRALADAFGPTLDHVAAFYVVGLCAAAVLEATLDPALVSRLGAPLDVAASALMAVPAYVCAQGTTPLAAVMVHKGLSTGAALAFLMVGPATNAPVLAMLRRHLGGRAALAFGAASLGVAIGAGLVCNALVPRGTLPQIHALVQHRHAGVEWLGAALLGLLLLASIVRLGPRAWFGAMIEGDPHAAEACGDPDHDHDHAGDHDHDHDHGHHRARGRAHRD